MNVSLPDALKDFVEHQVVERGYGTSSEFVRDLIRREQARDELRSLVMDGIRSGGDEPMDASYVENLRAKVRSSASNPE
jgi:antitoxin ParD1/3/4